MKKPFLYLAGCALVVGVLFQYSCKEDTIVKANIAPGNNEVGIFTVPDGFLDIITKTVYQDSLNTSDLITGVKVIHGAGTVVDPYFGKTNEGIYFQVLPAKENGFQFSSKQYTMDSAFVVVPYAGYTWGDTLNPIIQKLSLYELTESINVNDDYYSFQTKTVDRVNVLSKDLEVNIEQLRKSFRASTTADSMLINGKRVGSHIRFKLDVNDPNGYVKRIEKDVANGDDAFKSSVNYLNKYKGFYIEPDVNQNTNSLPYFFLDGSIDYSRAALVFYYHENDDPNTVKTAFFNFVRGDCAHYNWINRDYSGTPAKTVMDDSKNNPNVSDPVILMQNDPGAVMDIRIKNLKDLPVSIVNKAELVITKVSTGNAYADTTFTGPIRLDPFGVNDDGTLYEIEDRNYSDIATAIYAIGGSQRTVSINGVTVTQYTFNIPREVQKTIKDKRDELHLRIIGAKGFPGAYRLVAGGRTHSTYKVQMNIVYSKPQ